jgi:hypothetical protein
VILPLVLSFCPGDHGIWVAGLDYAAHRVTRVLDAHGVVVESSHCPECGADLPWPLDDHESEICW